MIKYKTIYKTIKTNYNKDYTLLENVSNRFAFNHINHLIHSKSIKVIFVRETLLQGNQKPI